MATYPNVYPPYPSPSFVPSNNPILYSQPNVANLQPAAQRTHTHGRHAPILPPSSFRINAPTSIMSPISFEQFCNNPVNSNDKTRLPNGAINFDYYNFRLELETISHIDEQKAEEMKLRRTMQQAAEEKAWNKLEQSKMLASQNTQNSTPKKEGVLLDLDFDSAQAQVVNTSYTPSISTISPTQASPVPSHSAVVYDSQPSVQSNSFSNNISAFPSSNSPNQSFSNPNSNDGYSQYYPGPTPMNYQTQQEQVSMGFVSSKSERLFVQLTELGLDTELIKIGLEVIGEEDESKLINFIADFQKLEDSPEHFRRYQVKHALLLHDLDFSKSLAFLTEWQKLTSLGFSDEAVTEGLAMFNNQILDTAKYLISFKRVSEFGFDSMRVKEALFLNELDGDKAIQYLLERT